MRQQYDSYKPSGIDWIGDIPSHWNIVRLAHIFNAKAGGDAKPELYSDTKDAQHPFPVFTNSLLEKQVYAYTSSPTFQSGSITVTGRGEIGHAFLRDTDFDAIIRLLVLTPRIGLCCKYFTYFIDGVMEFFSDSAAVSQLSAQQINKELVIIPPLAEQEAIAAWLDEKSGKIDAAIAKVDREIELIDELKQSEISRVVTRGLNPDAPLRPSGIDWIGDIPAHWRISPIKHICRSEKYSIKTGPFGSQLKGEDLKEEGDVRVYNQRNVIDNDFSEVSNYVTATKAKDLESFYTLPNDLLVTSRGTIGKSAILPVDVDMGILHPCLIALRIDESKANLNWVQIWINESDAFSKDIEAKSNATTIDVIYTETIKNIRIALPPLSEQQEIADYLDKKCAEIDGLKAKLTKKRETLTELRQSIISEVVTGKRKVI